MNEHQFGILIITTTRQENDFCKTAFERAEAAVSTNPAFVRVGHGSYVINLRDATPALAVMYAAECRRQQRLLLFALVPCGSLVFGEFPEAAAKALDALGLTRLDTSIPAAPPRS